MRVEAGDSVGKLKHFSELGHEGWKNGVGRKGGGGEGHPLSN